MKSELLHAIHKRQARITVVGLGYVGLPLLRAFSAAGFPSHGLDIDPQKTEALMKGQSYIKHIPDGEIARHVESGRMTAGTDFSEVSTADAILICVPTPLGEAREPDLRYIEATARSLAPHLKAGQLIVLESTTYPGTTENVLKPILAESGLDPEGDLFIAYSPEREDPGNSEFATGNTPKIVSGLTSDALEVTAALYSAITDKIIPVSSLATAEATKLTENVFRAVNIALVNELKVVYEKLGIDVWEVIDAAATKPFGFMPFYPGPGLGGHCIPIDPFYLSWVARAEGISTRFIELAGEINRDMPEYVVRKTADALNRQAGLALSRAKILLLGLAYKKNVDDLRESPALRIWQLLEDAGAEVAYFDPHISTIPKTREYSFLAGRRSITWSPDLPARFDCCIVVTDHDDFDYRTIAEKARLIIDTRNALRRAGHEPGTIVRA